MRFKTRFTAACAAGGLLLSLSAGKPSRAGAASNRVESGRALYVANCLDCHGATGRGDGRISASLRAQPTDLRIPSELPDTDGQLFQSITRGRRPMPRFDELLTDDERRAIVRYVRSLSTADTVARAK